jgi:hypothetical protein
MDERNGANSAMRSAIAQSKLLTDYLCSVHPEKVDLHFIENHLRSLFQFACSARSEATNRFDNCDWPGEPLVCLGSEMALAAALSEV